MNVRLESVSGTLSERFVNSNTLPFPLFLRMPSKVFHPERWRDVLLIKRIRGVSVSSVDDEEEGEEEERERLLRWSEPEETLTSECVLAYDDTLMVNVLSVNSIVFRMNPDCESNTSAGFVCEHDWRVIECTSPLAGFLNGGLLIVC